MCFEQTQEGRKAVEEAIAALKAAKPVRTLHRSAAMDKACADHVHGTSAVRVTASCGFVWLRVASCCCVASCGWCGSCGSSDCSATHHRVLPFAMYTNTQTNFGHTGDDGSSPSDRLNRYGAWYRGHGENLGFLHDAPSGKDVVVTWLIDDGVEDRGHRHNLLRGCWVYGGVSIGAHPGPVSHKVVGLFASDYDAPGEDEV